jgi:site-specific DNA-methyltransferase (adenine-specific)
MTPYYQDDHCTIYHGDCREILPTLEPCDLLLTDPPYGLGERWRGGGGAGWGKVRERYDEIVAWDGLTVVGVERLLLASAQNAVIWGGNYYALPPTRCWFVWDKKQNDQWSTAQAEMAWTNLDRTTRIFRMSQVEAYGDMLKEHPTQKPIKLMSWCIDMARHEQASTIIDPFMGSGTTLRAAKDRGMRSIGIEQSERYCELAAKRLAQEVLPL